MKKGVPALFQLTPKKPVDIKQHKFEAYLYLYGVFLGPNKHYTLEDQYDQDYAMIRSTKSNKDDITTYKNQGCVRVRFKAREEIIGNKNQVQFIFRVERKYKEDTDDIQIFIWKDLVKQEKVQFHEEQEGIDYIAFITDIPDDEIIEIYLRPFTKDVYTLKFWGLTAYLHD